jgi:hypothetical protein
MARLSLATKRLRWARRVFYRRGGHPFGRGGHFREGHFAGGCGAWHFGGLAASSAKCATSSARRTSSDAACFGASGAASFGAAFAGAAGSARAVSTAGCAARAACGAGGARAVFTAGSNRHLRRRFICRRLCRCRRRRPRRLLRRPQRQLLRHCSTFRKLAIDASSRILDLVIAWSDRRSRAAYRPASRPSRPTASYRYSRAACARASTT